MTSHPPALGFDRARLDPAFGQYVCRLFDEMPGGVAGHDEPEHCNRVRLLPISGHRLHGERRAAESSLMNMGVREEAIQINLLHGEGLEKRGGFRVGGHLSLSYRLSSWLRLYDTILTRKGSRAPQDYFRPTAGTYREYSAHHAIQNSLPSENATPDASAPAASPHLCPPVAGASILRSAA